MTHQRLRDLYTEGDRIDSVPQASQDNAKFTKLPSFLDPTEIFEEIPH